MATHLFEVGGNPTFTASASIANGQLVEVTGPRTAGPASADSTTWLGVASNDAAAGELFAVLLGGVQRIKVSAGVTAGEQVTTTALGTVGPAAAPAPAEVVGLAISTASAEGDLVDVIMTR